MRTIGDLRYIEVITKLRLVRKSQGLTQKGLSDRLSVPQSYVSKYETGERRLDVIELLDICTALDIEYKDILPKRNA